MFIFLLPLMIFPIIAAWATVTLGQKIKDKTTHKIIGHILIWTPYICCVWIMLSITILFNISSFPENVKQAMLNGNWVEALVCAPVILSAVVTIGAVTFAISQVLHTVHACVTIILYIPVIYLFFTFSTEFFG